MKVAIMVANGSDGCMQPIGARHHIITVHEVGTRCRSGMYRGGYRGRKVWLAIATASWFNRQNITSRTSEV